MSEMPTDEGRIDASDITTPIKLIPKSATPNTKPIVRMEVMPKNDVGWLSVLTPDQFEVLRNKGTEAPGFSERTPGELEYELKRQFNSKYPSDGAYCCAACGEPLYYAKTKFGAGCGWPAFYDGIPGAVTEVPDADGRRVEIVCTKCNGHLGHVFRGEGFPTPTNARHCVNGVSLQYDPAFSDQPEDVLQIRSLTLGEIPP